MNTQEAVQAVYQWFVVEQHGPSLDEPSCRYRGPNGAKCAAGVLIPDHLYNPTMEEMAIGDVCAQWREVGDYLSDVNPAILDRLQSAHDDAAQNDVNDEDFTAEMTAELREIMTEIGMEVPA